MKKALLIVALLSLVGCSAGIGTSVGGGSNGVGFGIGTGIRF